MITLASCFTRCGETEAVPFVMTDGWICPARPVAPFSTLQAQLPATSPDSSLMAVYNYSTGLDTRSTCVNELYIHNFTNWVSRLTLTISNNPCFWRLLDQNDPQGSEPWNNIDIYNLVGLVENLTTTRRWCEPTRTQFKASRAVIVELPWAEH